MGGTIHAKVVKRAYSNVGDFWLPQRTVSESMIRFGGTTTLMIDYDNYDFELSQATSARPNSIHDAIFAYNLEWTRRTQRVGKT